MKTMWCKALAVALVLGALAPATLFAQIPNVGSLGSSLLDKSALLDQAKKLVSDLTSMKSDPSVSAADKSKVDSMLPKATSVSDELAKPNVEPSKLTQLAGQLGDLQKEYGALKGVMK